ncbi:hypothetical protein ACLQ29_13770 [Micromonospora sp. DT228]|uniref:hypothetical protein n=1 Tax=Micromonospora sp. DT228 TaxID=3393443 RepID=UPI003CEF9F54
MEDVIGGIGGWVCSIMAVLATTWGVVVLVTGRAPRRELRNFQSVAQYGWFCIGLGVASGLLALSGLGGWFGVLAIVGLGLLGWITLRTHRLQRTATRQRGTTTDKP